MPQTENTPNGQAARVLDACCGSRMFWFDKSNPEALFVDKRCETHVQPLKNSKSIEIVVSPDIVADFTDLPFQDESFYLVVFDPPHLTSLNSNSMLAKKYGRLIGEWRDEIQEGFSECFRVLKPNGTLVFKWNSSDISLSEVLNLAPKSPLFGHTSGRMKETHWICFIK